jgi:hypothetical protein
MKGMRSILRRALVVLLLGFLPKSAAAGEPRMFLTWHAPYGLPGASDSLTRLPGDTTAVDTLYLSFDPGRSSSTYIGMTASVDFRGTNPRALGDSLSPAWNPAAGSTPPRLMKVEFPLDPPAACPFPWQGSGFSIIGYKRSPHTGQLRLVYAMPQDAAAVVDSGRVYTFARLVLRRPAVAAWGRQALCIEWARGSFAYSAGDEPTFDHGGHRFVSVNSPGGEICGPWREPEAPSSKPAGP